jgi:hypothetical protein
MGMSRQRALPVDIFTDERLIELPHEVRLTAIGLRLNADDHGRGSARRELLKAAVWPLTESITLDVIESHLVDLDDLEYIHLYKADGRELYSVTDWPAVSHPIPSKFPAPPAPADRARRPEFSGAPLAGLSAGERESERESGWRDPAEGEEGEGAWRDAEGLAGNPHAAPSKFCHEHPRGTLQPCGPCGTAREQNKLWEKRKRAQARAEFEGTD